MIKEISINFNKHTVELTAYRDYVGDLSLPSRKVSIYSVDDYNIDMNIMIINALYLSKEYDINCADFILNREDKKMS